MCFECSAPAKEDAYAHVLPCTEAGIAVWDADLWVGVSCVLWKGRGRGEREMGTYDGHAVVDAQEHGVLDTDARSAHEKVECVERDGREDPWRGIRRVVA